MYIDDLVVFSRSLEEHVVHLRKVMNRLSANLKLKPSKCHFLQQNVEFLGHLITPTGIGPNPKQIVAVKEFPIPQNLSQVRQFLGLTSYYRRFIGQFGKIASPLHELTRKGMEWHWTNEQQSAIDTLKTRFIEAPVLVYPNFKREFVLETDASEVKYHSIPSTVQWYDRADEPYTQSHVAEACSQIWWIVGHLFTQSTLGIS